MIHSGNSGKGSAKFIFFFRSFLVIMMNTVDAFSFIFISACCHVAQVLDFGEVGQMVSDGKFFI